MNDKLIIGGKEFSSRLFLGTGKFSDNKLMAESIKASETQMVTVAMKRVELQDENSRRPSENFRGSQSR